MKYYIFTLSLLFSFKIAHSQDTLIKLNRPQWNKTLNKAFLSILGAKSDNSIIGNYASFDPSAGSFTFKGSVPIGKESSNKISYLSLSINGDLISDSYSALFSNSKLNTNANIQAEWHIRLGRNRFVVDRAQIGQYSHDLGLLKQKLKDGISMNITDMQQAQNNLQLSKYQKENITHQLKIGRTKTDNLQWKVDSLFSNFTTVSYDDKKKWTDSLAHMIKDLEKLKTDSTALKFKCDSLSLVIADSKNYSYALDAKVLSKYDINKNSLDSILSLKKVEFKWITLIASTGKKVYYTFQDSLPFSNQINKHDTSTWKLGISWNYYNQNLLSNRAIYLNIGFSRLEDNNTNLLTAEDINQERVIKNAVGDTVRKITQKYSAYTDSVLDFKEWNISSNFYFLYGKRVSGFHVFPALHLPDGKKAYLNTGFGYVITFINNKKDQPVINAEGYIQYNDVFNSLKLSGKFWKRNEIGIRFSLPITLLTK